MPVVRYRTLDEAHRDLWCFDPDEEYDRRVARLWRLANSLRPPRYPQGVFRFRSLEDADRWEWESIVDAARLTMAQPEMNDLPSQRPAT